MTTVFSHLSQGAKTKMGKENDAMMKFLYRTVMSKLRCELNRDFCAPSHPYCTRPIIPLANKHTHAHTHSLDLQYPQICRHSSTTNSSVIYPQNLDSSLKQITQRVKLKWTRTKREDMKQTVKTNTETLSPQNAKNV